MPNQALKLGGLTGLLEVAVGMKAYALSTTLGILLVLLAGCGEKAKVPVVVENVRDLKALHAAMKKYLADHDQVWPQMEDPQDDDGSAYWSRWRAVLAPYGAEDADWMDSEDGADLHSSYLPMAFDANQGTATKWAGMPWFVEIATRKEELDETLLVLPSGEVISTSESTRRAKAEGRWIDRSSPSGQRSTSE